MHRKAFLALVVVCCLSATAYAVPTMTAGTWTFLAAPGQSTDFISGLPIEILVSGGDAVSGADLFLQSGPDGFTPGSAPTFAAVDLIGVGTVFGLNNTGQTSAATPPESAFETVTTAAGTEPASGTLAFITFDATGIAPGTYDFFLTNFFVIGASSSLLGVPSTTLVDGTVTVVIPEPGSIVLALFAAGGLCAVVIRRRRRKAA